jgi:hypothetical protein
VAYVARAEAAGIPSVQLGFSDQQALGRQVGLNNGCPNFRWVDVPRVGTGDQRVAQFLDATIKALTTPLTAKEKEAGLYSPPPDPRICFTGTLNDAQAFYQQTTSVSTCQNCPISTWTDGLPIIVPTEDKVKEMLTGTSHKPDEQICRYSMNATTKQVQKGAVTTFTPNGWGASVEKVAAIAVMSGCKPEYLPVVLAIASTGDKMPTSSMIQSSWMCVSGPMAKEIGMSAGQGALNAGNPANMTIGRSLALIIANLGGAIQGITRTDFGSPWNRGTAFAESEFLPSGWLGMNEEGGYKKTESVINLTPSSSSIIQGPHTPSSFRSLNSGSGGMARRLGVEGKPGNYNFLEYYIPLVILDRPDRSHVFIMHPNMAQSLKDAGFASKIAVLEWWWKASFIPVKLYRDNGHYDFNTTGGEKIEAPSGKKYKDLPDDYMIPSSGGTADSNRLLVSFGPGDEACIVVTNTDNAVYPIDVWK